MVWGSFIAFALSMTVMGLTGEGVAQASTVRPGAHNGQIDLLLDPYETDQARRSLWGTTVICWNSGVGGKMLAIGICQLAVSTCAAQAYYANPRRRAGMTVDLRNGNFWCWKY